MEQGACCFGSNRSRGDKSLILDYSGGNELQEIRWKFLFLKMLNEE